MNFRINIENALRQHMKNKEGRFIAAELCRHLKLLRDGLAAGDQSVAAKFFSIYVFSEDKKEKR